MAANQSDLTDLPIPYESICELPGRTASFGLQQWQIPRRFRVITGLAYPIPGPALIVACPGIPSLGSPYRDFSNGESIPGALLVDYQADETSNPREWIVTCLYSTQQLAPTNAGGLQSPPSPSRPQGGAGGTSPDDPTQLLPRVSTGTEIIRVPYFEDPQGNARFKTANGSSIAGATGISRYCNSAGEKFAAGATREIALETFSVSLYLPEWTNYDAVNNSVNFDEWDGRPARSMLLKPVQQTRERFGLSWFWLNKFDLVYDPLFFHTFTVLNAGFREITNPLQPLNPAARALRDITVNGQKTQVEWPLGILGQKITDPGANGSNLIYAEFNKYRASSVFDPVIPFYLSDFGIT